MIEDKYILSKDLFLQVSENRGEFIEKAYSSIKAMLLSPSTVIEETMGRSLKILTTVPCKHGLYMQTIFLGFITHRDCRKELGQADIKKMLKNVLNN